MATSFLHIFIRPKAGVANEEVVAKLNLAVDWYRYADYCWVVKTTSEVAKWQTRLKPLVEPDGTLLILTIDPTKRHGWVAKAFWEWLQKASAPKTGP
jgi:hypothetical protein